MMVGGGIFGFLIVGLLIYFLFTTFNQSNETQKKHYNNRSVNENALETLKLKYANGDISEEEYQRKKAILKGE